MTCTPTQPMDFRHGDVVAVGRRFYEVETESPKFLAGYARVLLRSLHDGCRGFYEFRTDLFVDVLRADEIIDESDGWS